MKEVDKIGQEQFHDFVFSEEISWQEIIYDLINTEQLDPWDINLSILAQKYLEKIREFEEANFLLSSKVLLVCSLLLRIKSELLLNRYIKNLDDILFKKDEEKQDKLLFKEEFDKSELPDLIPKTPLSRLKKVSLQELISALSKAVITEERRILRKRTEKEVYERTKFFMPRKTINIHDRIKEIHSKVKELFKVHNKIKFSEFSGPKKQDKIDYFIPLLHLDTNNNLWLHQEKHLDEIWIYKNKEHLIKKEEVIIDNIERNFEESLDEINNP
ncbi:MAG: segregation/condensation protein A [Candidatus Pacearchaeota archaeon]